MTVMRLKLTAADNTPRKQVVKNCRANTGYPSVTWGIGTHRPCIVVGGGVSTAESLDMLREWAGDIFAINDTAAYLSRHGIKSYLFALDSTRKLYEKGIFIQGAVFATRVHPSQFIYNDIRTWEMREDSVTGIWGGPSAAARAPHLFLRMGYSEVYFLGIDASFSESTHVSGDVDVGYNDMLIVRVNGIDYLTNGGLLAQSEWMLETLQKYPNLLKNLSGGLFEAMLDNPETWSVVAIGKDLKEQYESKGCTGFNKYNTDGRKIWQPSQAI